jgi:hypothetical protein
MAYNFFLYFVMLFACIFVAGAAVLFILLSLNKRSRRKAAESNGQYESFSNLGNLIKTN